MEKLKQHLPVIHEPPQKATSVLIWMHGLGADAHDFEGILPLLPIAENNLRVVFPNAPIRPVTINNGMTMPAWYDIKDLELRQADQQGITSSQRYIDGLIDEQIKAGIASDRILLGGFSQGGAMALFAGLRSPHKLGGVIGLSCYLLDSKNTGATAINKDTPVLIAHGTHDPVVAYPLGEQAAQVLTEQGYKVTFSSYPMQHEVSMPEINALAGWINKRLD